MTEADDIRMAAVEAGEEIQRSMVEAVRLADEERAKLTGQVQDDRRDDAPPERQLTTDQVQQDRRDDEVGNRGNIQQDRRDDEVENRGNIQQDRRDDEVENRGHIQQDRRDDEKQNRGNIQQDRRDDEKQNRGDIQQDRRDDQGPERTRTADRIRSERLADVQASTDQIQRDRRDDEAPRTALELVRADKLTQSIVLLESIRRMCVILLVVLACLGMGLTYLFDYMGETRAKVGQSSTAAEDVEAAFRDFIEENQQIQSNHERTQRLICAWYRATNQPLPDNGDCEGR